MTERMHSAGGLALSLPEGWVEVAADEHLSAFVTAPLSSEMMAPTCLVNDHPGHLDLPTWWGMLQASSEGPLLLDATEHPEGFDVTYALVSRSVSTTGHARVMWLPGRSLVVTVAFDSDRLDDLLPVARSIAASVAVEGLP